MTRLMEEPDSSCGNPQVILKEGIVSSTKSKRLHFLLLAAQRGEIYRHDNVIIRRVVPIHGLLLLAYGVISTASQRCYDKVVYHNHNGQTIWCLHCTAIFVVWGR